MNRVCLLQTEMPKNSKTHRAPIDPSRPRTAKPHSAATVLENALRAFGIEGDAARYAAFPRWREIVGDDVANVAFPERITRGNVLVIRVLDSAWSQELSLQKASLLSKLQAIDEGAFIDDLRFITGDPRSVHKRRNRV